MAQQYYIRANGKVHGPVGTMQLKQLAAEGKLKPEHEVSEDHENWRLAVKYKGLPFKDELASPPKRETGTAPPPIRTESLPSRPAEAENRKTPFTTKVPLWMMVVIPSLATLTIGYFSGREHAKYEIRKSFEDFGEELGEVFGDSELNTELLADDEIEPGTVVTGPPPRLKIGEAYAADGVSIELVQARIEKPRLKDSFDGDTRISKDTSLVVEAKVTNTDDRRILRLDKFSSKFGLRDDVDNDIRGVIYYDKKPLGLTEYDDVNPGESATYIEIFVIPPPKTHYLIVDVDLERFGREGNVEFKIPASDIER